MQFLVCIKQCTNIFELVLRKETLDKKKAINLKEKLIKFFYKNCVEVHMCK